MAPADSTPVTPSPTFPDGAPIPADQVAAAAALPPAASIVEPAKPPAPIIMPTVGRVVYFAQRDRNGTVQARPALIVNVFPRYDGLMPLVNLVLLRDGSNDEFEAFLLPELPAAIDPALRLFLDALQRKVFDLERLVQWKTSASYDQDGAVNTWRWMPFQLGQAAKPAITAEQLAAIVGALEDLDVRLEQLETVPTKPAPSVGAGDAASAEALAELVEPAPAPAIAPEAAAGPKPYRVH